ncbi:MAG: hypothetical protein JW849_10420 [Phycisphaerae bacterium]|nr:hypothetical protein [Phycisphaerae bacterium]
MRRAGRIGLMAVLAGVVWLQPGCDKKKTPDRSVSRTAQPEENGEANEPSVIGRIQVRENPYSKIDKNDLTPMSYLAIVVRSRDRGKLTKSLMNLRSVGQAIEMYRTAEGSYPPSSKALTDADYISAAALQSAGSREHEILYLPPASEKPNSTDVLVFDPVCYPVNVYAVLLIDGTAGTMTLEELKIQFQQQGVK